MKKAARWLGLLCAVGVGFVVVSCGEEMPTEPQQVSTPTTTETASNPADDAALATPLFDSQITVTPAYNCMGDEAVGFVQGWNSPIPGGTVCTAEDVELADVTDVTCNSGCTEVGGVLECEAGTDINLTMTGTFQSNANSDRADIGVWLDLLGPDGNALSGTCQHFYFQGQMGDFDGDACDDMAEKIVYTGVTMATPVTNVTLKCNDSDGNGDLDTDVCIGWKIPGQNEVCPNDAAGDGDPPGLPDFVKGTLPGTNSQCRCGPLPIPVKVKVYGYLEVVKDLDEVPSGTSQWDVFIKEGTTTLFSETGGDGTTTGTQKLEAGTTADPGADYIVGEAWSSGTAASFYNSSYSCVDRGTTNVRYSGSGMGPQTVALMPEDDIVCTFKNDGIDPPAVTVKKTVDNTNYDRMWKWTIDKTADYGGRPPVGGDDVVFAALGQTIANNYKVKITGNYTDSNWNIDGTITVSAAASTAPYSGALVVTDKVAGNDATVKCPDEKLVPGGSVKCTYTYAFPSAPTGSETNIATAKVTWNTGATDTQSSAAVPVTFGKPTKETDETLKVSDTNSQFGTQPKTWDANTDGSGVQGQMKTWTYVIPLSCPDYGADFSIPNTASFLTDDTGAKGESKWLVNVLCPSPPDVCTLTQGYWKNHCLDSPDRDNPGCNAKWPDDNWENVGLLGEDEIFFQSGDSWIGVFTTPPAGGNQYYNLAHQWMAAELNRLNGAAIPGAVQQAYDEGLAVLKNCTPSEIGALKGNKIEKCSGFDLTRKDITDYAGMLGDFNEGMYSQHCTEDSDSDI